MKFLCLDCDQPMKLHSTEGPDEGSLSVTFRCPECGFRVAMLTNPFETQMVRSLGVKVGGQTVPPEPFEHLRGSLAGARPDAFVGGGGASETGGPGCPFAAALGEAPAAAHDPQPAHRPDGHRRRPRAALQALRRAQTSGSLRLSLAGRSGGWLECPVVYARRPLLLSLLLLVVSASSAFAQNSRPPALS